MLKVLVVGLCVTMISACAPYVPTKPRYADNERLQVEMEKRIVVRNALREKLVGPPGEDSKEVLTADIAALNTQIYEIKTSMGYRSFIEPILASRAPATRSVQKGEVVRVIQEAWDELTVDEQRSLEVTRTVEMRQAGEFGVIIDGQGADQSTPGTNGGAIVGGALAQTAYIDRAFRGGSYSATTQLGLGLLGAALGSTLDQSANQQYRIRYALRLRSGEIAYRETVSSSPFRYAVGECMDMGPVTTVLQAMCNQTGASLRRDYLAVVVEAMQPVAIK